MLALSVAAAGLAWWLGLYLIRRDPGRPLLRRAGAGLLAFALALAADALSPLWPALGQAPVALTLLPAVAWTGALLELPPDPWPPRARLVAAWRLGLAPASLALIALGAAAGALDPSRPGPLYLALAALALLPLAAALALAVRALLRGRATLPSGVLAFAGICFGLGAAAALAPLGWVPRPWLLLGVGVDLALLGVAAAASDALEAGEALRADMLRSLLAALGAALLFGGQVALAMALAPAPQLAALLFATVAAAAAASVLADPIDALLDRLAFARQPAISRQRADLRASEAALPRRDDSVDPLSLAEADFARLTRRALSHYGDLPRLAASPLTGLPEVSRRLAARGAPDQPLERAAELKALLAESIARLRPRGDAAFGTTDEWRHYNALYFPYVLGLRPFSRRPDDAPDEAARQALEWFAASVPERTLHNWQTAAARLVAQDLRAQGGPPPTAPPVPSAEVEGRAGGRSGRPHGARQP